MRFALRWTLVFPINTHIHCRHRIHKSIPKIHPHTESFCLKHNHFWRWYKAEMKMGRSRRSWGIYSGSKVLLCLCQQGGDTFLSVGNLYFIFYRRVQWAYCLLDNCTFPDRSTAAPSHTSVLSKHQLLYTEHLYYSSRGSSALLKGILTLITVCWP